MDQWDRGGRVQISLIVVDNRSIPGFPLPKTLPSHHSSFISIYHYSTVITISGPLYHFSFPNFPSGSLPSHRLTLLQISPQTCVPQISPSVAAAEILRHLIQFDSFSI